MSTVRDMGIRLFGQTWNEDDMTYQEQEEIAAELTAEGIEEEGESTLLHPDYEGVTVRYSDGAEHTYLSVEDWIIRKEGA